MKPMVDKIIHASIAILKREGVEGLSMRAIAREVELHVSTLYSHISRKRDLYYLISEYICHNINYPSNMDDPRGYLIELNQSFRRELLKIKHSAFIFAEIIPNTPKHLEFFNKNMEALSALGVEDSLCFPITKIINNYVMASVWDEEFFRAISRDASPGTGKAFYRSKIAGANYDNLFLNGLEVILNGLQLSR